MTKEQLNAIQTRADAATPGPWRQLRCIITFRGGDYIGTIDDLDDATFVSGSREDIPALIAEVRRLQEAAPSFDSLMKIITEEYGCKIQMGGALGVSRYFCHIIKKRTQVCTGYGDDTAAALGDAIRIYKNMSKIAERE